MESVEGLVVEMEAASTSRITVVASSVLRQDQLPVCASPYPKKCAHFPPDLCSVRRRGNANQVLRKIEIQFRTPQVRQRKRTKMRVDMNLLQILNLLPEISHWDLRNENPHEAHGN